MQTGGTGQRKETSVTAELRWRIVVLQVALVVILAFGSGFLYWAANFTHGNVHDQLIAQNITFPAADSASIKALPAVDAAAMKQYAGQQMTNGDQAETWANHYIKIHLQGIGGGKTYSEVSALSMASPKNTALAAEVQTLVRGETLRGLLLNAWGWWTVGSYALYAAIGLTFAAVVVFLSMIYELFLAPGLRPRDQLVA